jgi:hypothetical protein
MPTLIDDRGGERTVMMPERARIRAQNKAAAIAGSDAKANTPAKHAAKPSEPNCSGPEHHRAATTIHHPLSGL